MVNISRRDSSSAAPAWRAAAVLVAATVHLAFGHVAGTSAQSMRTLDDRLYSEPQAGRGERLYAENCAPCHAADLSGTELAPPVALRQLAAGRWSGSSLARLFDVMRLTMPLNSPGGLSAAQNADILAFMLLRGKYPTGDQELPATPEFLENVTIPAAGR